MREIKFRAWDEPNDKGGPSGMSYNVRPDCDATAIMQFTGLKDKNGKEIYEGDIVTYPNPEQFGVIKFGEYEFGSYDTYQRGCGFYIDSKKEASQGAIQQQDIIVIGNIYENPELLERSKS